MTPSWSISSPPFTSVSNLSAEDDLPENRSSLVYNRALAYQSHVTGSLVVRQLEEIVVALIPALSTTAVEAPAPAALEAALSRECSNDASSTCSTATTDSGVSSGTPPMLEIQSSFLRKSSSSVVGAAPNGKRLLSQRSSRFSPIAALDEIDCRNDVFESLQSLSSSSHKRNSGAVKKIDGASDKYSAADTTNTLIPLEFILNKHFEVFHLRVLRLPNNNLHCIDCDALAGIIRANEGSLVELDLSRNPLEFSGLTILVNSIADTTHVDCSWEHHHHGANVPRRRRPRARNGDDTEEASDLDSQQCTKVIIAPSRLEILDLSDTRLRKLGEPVVARLIQHNRSIRCLRLAGNQMGGKSVLRALQHNNAVVTVDLSDNDIKRPNALPHALRALRALLDPVQSPRSQLQSLILRGNTLGSAGTESIVAGLVGPDDTLTGAPNVKRNRNLITLDLSFNSLGEEGADEVGTLLRYNDTLKEIRLDGNGIADLGLRCVVGGLLDGDKDGCRYTGLELLSLSSNMMTDEAAEYLHHYLKQPGCRLRSLNLANNEITSNGAALLAERISEANCTLRNLIVEENKIGDDGAQAFIKVLICSRCAVDIQWKGNKFSPEMEDQLDQIPTFRQNRRTWLEPLLEQIKSERLICIDLSSRVVAKHELDAISVALRQIFPTVPTFKLRGLAVTPMSISRLTSDIIQRSLCIQTLFIDDASIGNAGAEMIAQALVENHKIRILSLIGCQVGSKGAIALANAIRRNRTITRLSLANNKIGDHGARHVLAAALEEFLVPASPNGKDSRGDAGHRRLPVLTSLTLSSNSVTDAGITVINCFGHLKELALADNYITDRGALDLARACIPPTAISQNGTQHLPSCNSRGLNGSNRSLHDSSTTIRPEVSQTCQIRRLDISGNRLSARGIQTLRIFVPDAAWTLECENQLP
jgi:Ran GTPase-activating protein (RanGAP) involved in mRNA processing and transport